MSSIANRKYTDMRQIEFQQNGSSRVTAMLTQPLLENSSTYMCEVTDFECSIGEELAFPENQWLFSIIRWPSSQQYNIEFSVSHFETHMKRLATQPTEEVENYMMAGVFGWVNNAQQTYEPGMVLDVVNNVEIHFPDSLFEEYRVYSRRYYSVMDMVYDVSQQLKEIDRKISLKRNAELVAAGQGGDATILDWTEFDEEAWHNVSLTFDSGGRLQFNLKETFMNRYQLFTSPLFQRVTGFPLFVGMWAPVAVMQPPEPVNNLEEYRDRALFVQNDGGLDIYDILEPDSPPGVDLRTEVRDMVPIQEGIDVRKKIVVEVSLPISHTLAWDGVRESTRYVLQEFNFPSEQLDLSFENTGDFRTSKIRFKERGLHGQVLFLNGGSNLAIKKLNEGQMQAFRIDVLVERNRWDPNAEKFVSEKRNLEMGVGGFFYLKLLFTKETI